MPSALASLLASFPPVQHAFAYGSAVFLQPGLYVSGPGGSRPVLDFIFAVEDPAAWHAENLARHRSHYSALGRWLGPAAVVAVAERVGAGVYFNTLVPWALPLGGAPAGQAGAGVDAAAAEALPHHRHWQQDQGDAAVLIKYGVMATAALEADLRRWTALYAAGRMHKPVATLARHPSIAAAQSENLRSALRAALLLLPPRFGGGAALRALCALSYSGDVRMGVAEDGRKVERIVGGSGTLLALLYRAPMEEAAQRWGGLRRLRAGGGGAGAGEDLAGGEWEQDDSPAAAAALVAALPEGVLLQLAPRLGLPAALAAAPGGAAEIGAAAGGRPRPETQRLVHAALSSIVRSSSRRQAVAGLLSAGLVKSVRYAGGKLRKAWG